MARTYRRDSRGRFASGGGSGGGGGAKAASTRARNTARASALKAKGTTGIGSRVKAKGFVGGQGAQQRAGGLRRSGAMGASALPFTVGKGGKQSGAQSAASKGAIKRMAQAKSSAGQAGKPMARTNKSPVSAAKARYKQLSGTARKSSSYRSAADNRAAAGAKRSLKSMIAKRGRR